MVCACATSLRSCVNAYRMTWIVSAAFGGLFACAGSSGAQPSAKAMAHPVAQPLPAPSRRDSLPFGAGEKLSFTIRTAKYGKVGKAVMTLTGPVDVRGTETMLASFDESAGCLIFKGRDAT